MPAICYKISLAWQSYYLLNIVTGILRLHSFPVYAFGRIDIQQRDIEKKKAIKERVD